MDFSAIGEKIKELRKAMSLSQKELAKDICTQAQISKIEKGDVIPFASTLYLISDRLGVDVNYFFDIGTTPRLDYIQEVSRQLKLARRELDYKKIQEMVRAEEKNPLFTANKKNRQLLLWHKAICEYHVNQNSQKALCFIDEAIALTCDKARTERELELFISKAVFLYEEGLTQQSLDIYLVAKEHLEKMIYLHDETIRSKLMYNMAKALTKLGRFDQSISLCEEAIQSCIDKDNFFLLGDLHYQIGYNYELQQQFSEAKTYMEKTLFFFKLEKNERFVMYIQDKINGWNKEM